MIKLINPLTEPWKPHNLAELKPRLQGAFVQLKTKPRFKSTQLNLNPSKTRIRVALKLIRVITKQGLHHSYLME